VLDGLIDMRISFCISTGSAMNTSGSTSGGMSKVFEFEDVVLFLKEAGSSTIIVDGLLVFEFEAPEDVAFVVLLEEVFLEEVFLEEVFLEEAFLEEAFLEEALLEEAFLEEAFLEEALLDEEVEEVVEEVETTSLDEVLFFFLLFLFFFLSPGVFTIFLFAASTLFFTSRLFT
jgi:hypothetical protein